MRKLSPLIWTGYLIGILSIIFYGVFVATAWDSQKTFISEYLIGQFIVLLHLGAPAILSTVLFEHQKYRPISGPVEFLAWVYFALCYVFAASSLAVYLGNSGVLGIAATYYVLVIPIWPFVNVFIALLILIFGVGRLYFLRRTVKTRNVALPENYRTTTRVILLLLLLLPLFPGFYSYLFNTYPECRGKVDFWESRQRTSCHMQQARLKRDAKICDYLIDRPSWLDRTKCIQDVALAQDNIGACDATPNKWTCISSYAVKNNDVSLCKKIMDPQMKGYCYSELAIKTGDGSLCSRCDTEDCNLNKIECLQRTASKTNNADLCTNFPDQAAKDDCIWEVAWDYGDPSTCEKLSCKQGDCKYDKTDGSYEFLRVSPDYPEKSVASCYIWITQRRRDLNICEKIIVPYMHDLCILQNTSSWSKQGNLKHCQKLTDPKAMTICEGK